MKVKIKRKILEESKLDHKFPTTAQYRQTQPVQSDKAFNHAGEDIQFSRIEIGKNIDRFLQRPFVTVGDEFDEPDGSITKITNPKETFCSMCIKALTTTELSWINMMYRLSIAN